MAQVHFGKTPSISRTGGGQARPYIKVSRSAGCGEQVAFQLGKRLRDSARCPFGLEKTHVDAAESEPYKVLKLELNESARQAINSLERATVEAAVASSEVWFPSKKLSQSTVEENFQTKIYSSASTDGSFPGLLKLKVAVSGGRQTKVLVTHEKADGGYSKPVAGSWSDLTRGCKVLPCIKVAGGVYIVNRSFGTSLVATELCVVKEKKDAGAPVELDLGSDVDDGSECDPDADE